ncbi:MAG: hypothetical protein QXZ44_02880 [Ferroplasma sp.]
MASLDDAIKVAKDTIKSEFNVDNPTVIDSSRDSGGWIINLTFILNNEQKYYTIKVQQDGAVSAIKESKTHHNANPGRAPMFILIAYVLAIVAVISYILLIIYEVSTFMSLTTLIRTYGGSAISSSVVLDLIIYAIFFFIMFIISLYLFMKIGHIRRLMIKKKYDAALEVDSIGFGIVALIFGWAIIGILALIARPGLEQAATE